ncbi:MAG TPA: bifunctional UDP-N-acetylglucosamine diphosphorylase/glucosamine-1-phosphate N-acetyltransferase GlmU [Chloroflexota bacterium]
MESLESNRRHSEAAWRCFTFLFGSPVSRSREREGRDSDDPIHLAVGSPDLTQEAIVLAAGKGTRMRTSLPKVLHGLAGKPMLVRVLDALHGVGFSSPAVVVGYRHDEIEQVIGDRCRYIVQSQQRGTGHAALTALEALDLSVQRVLVASGDEPMIESETFRNMLNLHLQSGAAVTLLTAIVDDTRGFGRVIRNDWGKPMALVQVDDLTPQQHAIREVSFSAYVFDADFLRRTLPRLQPHPPKDELYLTDVVAMAVDEGLAVEALTIPADEATLGINTLVHLEGASKAVYQQINRRLMESGVTIVDSASTFIDEDAVIEPDTVIYPFTFISGPAHIGRACIIGPSSRIVSSTIGERCTIEASTVEESVVEDDVRIGPYAHLRPGARIGSRVEVGNFAEIKRSSVGPDSRVHHFSYLGDAQVGARVNIGAGTVTCNFDGVEKHQTIIEDDAFIGSDTMLRAPVRVGEGAATGAGAVVTRDVKPGKLAVGMPARTIKEVERATASDSDKSELQEQRS